jgi:hypothetical protein
MRVDDDSVLLSNIDYDPFRIMQANKVKYGWLLYYFESQHVSSRTLWNFTQQVPLLTRLVYLPQVQEPSTPSLQLSAQRTFRRLWALPSLSLLVFKIRLSK